MAKRTGDERRSVAIDSDVYGEVCRLAEEAETTRGAVASAVIRLGLKYYRARWSQFLQTYPELRPNGRDIPYTTNTPVVPRQ